METPPRPQAVIQNLPKEKQDAIWEYRFGKPRHTQLQTVKWLRDDGITTSSGALSYWERSYVVERKMDDNKVATDQMITRGKAEGWIKTAEEEQAIAQCFFNRLAAQEMDAKAWFLMQSVNVEKEKLALARQKLDQSRQELELKLKQYEDRVAEQKRKIETAVASSKSKGGLTPETLAQIEEAAKLL
jgi:hypothetical protein